MTKESRSTNVESTWDIFNAVKARGAHGALRASTV
jgi:hypothetical protein